MKPPARIKLPSPNQTAVPNQTAGPNETACAGTPQAQRRRRSADALGCAGPWIWGYAGSGSAVASHVFFLFAFGPLTLLIVVLRPAAFVVFAAGLWLALSPWLLGYATNHSAWLSELVTGALLSIVGARAAGISVSQLLPGRSRRPVRGRFGDRRSRRLALVGVGSHARAPCQPAPGCPAVLSLAPLERAGRRRGGGGVSRRPCARRHTRRLIEGCGRWIATAGVLELLSAVGFVVLFKLVFAGPVSWRRTAPAALRALGRNHDPPGRRLIGPAIGAWSAGSERLRAPS